MKYILIAILATWLPALSAQTFEELSASLNAQVQVYEPTGNVSFFQSTESGIIAQDLLATDDKPESVARAFLQRYGASFGVQDAINELDVRSSQVTKGKTRHTIRFDQYRNGIPIFGADIAVRLDESLAVLGANGHLSSKPSDYPADVDIEAAANIALAVASRANPTAGSFSMTVSEPKQIFYNAALLEGGRNEEIAALYFIVTNEAQSVRQAVIISARTADLLITFSERKEAKNRVVHDMANDPTLSLPGPVARDETSGATGVPAVDNAFEFTGDFYDFMFNNHARDSIDGNGLLLRSLVRYCPDSQNCPFKNAFWNGSFMTYGDGFAVDDVVSHELAHGFTQYTSNLIYLNQSGAINESLSDLWGEVVDLSNSGGNDDISVRWLLGEDIPGIGAIRNMADPGQFDDPDRITSSNYFCGADDNGGVHINSGVNNKAVSLMVDGGAFNGVSVTGIGIGKMADVYYQAQTNYLTQSSTYNMLDMSLRAACTDIVGIDGITTADCASVGAALDAVEMTEANSCVVQPVEYCDAGQPVDSFTDGFETGSLSSEWQQNSAEGSGAWSVQSTNPNNGLYSAHGENPAAVSLTMLEMTVDVSVPADGFFAVNHAAETELNWDGGVIEYSLDNGVTWSDALLDFPVSGADYNGVLDPDGLAQNPLQGRRAFTGFSDYRRTRLELSSIVGQTVRFRFSIGSDQFVSAEGWYVDDVKIYRCGGGGTPPAATLISPSGTISDTTPEYTWNAVSDSTRYQLWVNDDTGNPIQTWYTAAVAGCSAGTGTCSVTPTTPVSGNATWWIRTDNSAGNGPWSSSLSFVVGSGGVPGPATLVSPNGTISDATPEYTWNAVSDSTRYQLWVNDDTGNPIQTWYTAAEAGCSAGTGTCSVTPATPVSGNATWWIRTDNSAGNGPWSSSLSFVVGSGGVPGPATLVSPSGTISDATPEYTWNAVSDSTWYQLWVNDDTGTPIQTWYTAAEAGCSAGTGTCSVTPATPVSGNATWWIRTYNSSGNGPWSSSLSFAYEPGVVTVSR